MWIQPPPTIITYTYTGNLAINDSTVEQLYETACFLQVEDVLQIYREYLIKKYSEESMRLVVLLICSAVRIKTKC